MYKLGIKGERIRFYWQKYILDFLYIFYYNLNVYCGGVLKLIELTKLNNKKFVINSDLIETVEAMPDTTISLTTGNKFVVREEVHEVIHKVIEFKQQFNLFLQKKREEEKNG